MSLQRSCRWHWGAGLVATVVLLSLAAPAGAVGRAGAGGEQLIRSIEADLGQNDDFGFAVSADDRTLVIGAPRANGNVVGGGAVYVYDRQGAVYVYRQKLSAGFGTPLPTFGAAVAVSGDFLVIGAPHATVQCPPTFADRPDAGFVQLYRRDSGGNWSFFSSTSNCQTAPTASEFGRSVALSGTLMAVGHPRGKDGGGIATGRVLVSEFNGTSWVGLGTLFSPNPRTVNDAFGFGHRVAVSGDTVIASDPGTDLAGGDSGQACVWRRQAGQLVAVGCQNGNAPGQFEGYAVGASGSRVATSAPGPLRIRILESASGSLVFERDLPYPADNRNTYFQSLAFSAGRIAFGEWDTALVYSRMRLYEGVLPGARDTSRLLPVRPIPACGVCVHYTGISAALDGAGRVVMGSQNLFTKFFSDRGEVRVYGRRGELPAIDGTGSEGGPQIVALSSDTMAIGTPLGSASGNVRMLRRNGGAWNVVATLTPTGGGIAGERFGKAVDLDEDAEWVIVGAPDVGAGRAVLFRRTGVSSWTQAATLESGAPVAGGHFGASVAISRDGTLIVVGAPDEGADGNAYAFRAGTIAGFPSSDGNAKQIVGATGTALPYTGSIGDKFGTSVATNGDVAAAGAPGADSGAGAVTVYEDVAGGFVQDGAELTAAAPAAGDGFGTAIDMDQGLLVVGAPLAGADQGTVTAYVDGGGGFSSDPSPDTLTSATGGIGDKFGTSVSVSDGTIVAGAPAGDVTSTDIPQTDTPTVQADQGYTTVYRPGTAGLAGTWTEDQRLVTGDGAAGDDFGTSVAVYGDQIAVLAPDAGPGDTGLIVPWEFEGADTLFRNGFE